jgi:hypothetical protein
MNARLRLHVIQRLSRYPGAFPHGLYMGFFIKISLSSAVDRACQLRPQLVNPSTAAFHWTESSSLFSRSSLAMERPQSMFLFTFATLHRCFRISQPADYNIMTEPLVVGHQVPLSQRSGHSRCNNYYLLCIWTLLLPSWTRHQRHS